MNTVTTDTPLATVERMLLSSQADVEAWFRDQWEKTKPPFYGSVDLRNAGFKLAPIDTNLFPAGFNNLNPDFMPLYVQAAQATLTEFCPKARRLLLVTENHTRNLFYLDSVSMLRDILQTAGYEVRVAAAIEELTTATTFDLPSGRQLTVERLVRKDNKVGVDDYFPCCIVLNNDLSGSIPDVLEGVDQSIMPSLKLGWANRLKSEHFRFYEQVANEFAQRFDFDSWLINPLFDQCPEVDFMKSEGQQCLIHRATSVLKKVARKYAEYGIEHKPFLVVKADQGTYGMAVMMIHDPEELASLNRKQRTKMSTTKGGVAVTKAIIQEGVYSFETAGKDDAVAEPVVYSIGRHVLGGFYRLHKNRGPAESLNAPGMDFLPLPFSQVCNMPCDDLDKPEGQFYIYGVVARLAQLAAAREIASFS